MMTSPNTDIFRVTGPLWGESNGHRWVPLKKASDAEVEVFFDLHTNKRLSKQSRRWWVETPSLSLWRHCMDSVLLVLFFKVPWVLMRSHRPSFKMAFDLWNVFWYPFYQHRLIKIRDLYVIACIILCEIWPLIQGITSTVVVCWAWMILYGCNYNINMP